MSVPYSLNKHGKRKSKIVLTGGPCAGKTTAMKEIADKIKTHYNDEWQVFTVSEASSFLYTGRVERHTLNDEQIYQWQKDVLKTIKQLESVYDNIADHETDRHTVIICDRGGMDPKAYTPGENTWKEILNELETEEEALLERYHMVIQMHTAPKYRVFPEIFRRVFGNIAVLFAVI
ncbi:unnamed protein product [Bursaphelenchus xylophilus]|uniref:(pine wood nematode) hypothetical protein n=1 Tax=Bursaphelenchus xylophilus TaxID=6326 RepID=A0A1I7SWA3_BURXY|nr:unnamed protein product [Bursaphelenchus xylophilus]CAG9099082.1 unnamed protein product [Bursaphelenchus xylophilus]